MGPAGVGFLVEEADCAIIVGVMSFSTCLSLAVENGAHMYSYPWKDKSANEYDMSIGERLILPSPKISYFFSGALGIVFL
jgi:2-phosphosulfolactate phosphatase